MKALEPRGGRGSRGGGERGEEGERGRALTVHVGVRGFMGAKFIFLGHTLIQKSADRYSGDKHSLPLLGQMR